MFIFADIKSEDSHKIKPWLLPIAVYSTDDGVYSRSNVDGKTWTLEIGAIKLAKGSFIRIRVTDSPTSDITQFLGDGGGWIRGDRADLGDKVRDTGEGGCH